MLPWGSPTMRPSTGSPNVTEALTPTPQTNVQTQLECKEPGWTNWMNFNKPTDGNDIEFLPGLVKSFKFCRADQIGYIQCRKVSNKESYDVTDSSHKICNTKAGFACYGSLEPDGKCEDYEIRVYCQCTNSGEKTVCHMSFLVFLLGYPSVYK